MLRPSCFLLIGGGLLLLAGCGGAESDDTRKASTKTPLGAVGESLRPGLYRVVQTGDVSHEEQRCIQAADVAAARFATPGSLENDWTVDANRMSDGTIEVSARHPSGSRLTIGGTFQDDSFDIEGLMEMKLNGEKHVIRTRQQGAFSSPVCPDELD